MKFKVDLNASDRPERFTEEGEYTVTIDSVERALTSNGIEKAVIIFKDDKNRSVKDDLMNKDTVYWRLNQLIIASGMKVPHGAEFDFSKSGEFFNFVRSFVGMKVGIILKSESYTSKDGEQKSILKVTKFSKSSEQPF
jgi:uncharacterized protein YegP (UPF0339 family)